MKFDFVGGTNEFGENLEETLIREVKEETGLSIEIESMFPWSISKIWQHADYAMHTLVFCFRCRVDSGTESIGDRKIHSLIWMKPEDMKSKIDSFLPTTGFFIKRIFEL